MVRLFLKHSGLSTQCDYHCRACYVAVAFYTCGMVLLGAGFQKHLTIAAFIIGWGLVEIATMINTTVVRELYTVAFTQYKSNLY